MFGDYSKNELGALIKLASYRNQFSVPEAFSSTKRELLKEEIKMFIQIFCAQDFANSDYSLLQKKRFQFATIKEWIEQLTIDEILKYLTYIIWLDKTREGFFVKSINDGTFETLLARLELLMYTYLPVKYETGASVKVISTAAEKNEKPLAK